MYVLYPRVFSTKLEWQAVRDNTQETSGRDCFDNGLCR